MSARGFALLAVLWTLAAVSGAVAVTMTALSVGNGATRNRVLLSRGRWAAEACLAIAAARRAEGRASETATIDLGRGTTCTWRVDDPAARLNVNFVDRSVLARFLEGAGLRTDSVAAVVDAVVAQRSASPLRSVEQLAAVPGFPASVLPLVTVDGPGRVNPSAASGAVLQALPGMTAEAVDLLLTRRAQGRPVASLDLLAGLLSPAGRETLLASYADLAALLVFASPALLLTADGWVDSRGAAPHAVIELLVVPLPDRLAIVRRRMT